MIGKIIPRKHKTGSFRDSVNYNLGLSRGDTDKVEYVNTLNIFEPSMAIREMEAVAMENTLSKNPLLNCILSWRENEIPSREQADEAVRIALRELGLEGCQTHYALHRNTQNLHLHICVNRIDPETYKAIDPAHGWTKKALERAARKIELAQGWEIERSGRYTVTADGEILEKTGTQEAKIRLSQTARDIEAHTRARSAERIAQEVATPIIRDAESWEELHQGLAAHGIFFNRKGSGAVLQIGETTIKASLAGREASLSKLEKRLGAFREREGHVDAKPRPLPRLPEPVDRVKATPRIRGAWEQYQTAKAGYFNQKRAASAALRGRQKNEREALYRGQRQTRGALLSESWKGRGMELNRHRSVMAAKQKSESLSLRDRQKEEREALALRFPRQFPNFKTWLSAEKDPALAAAFRHPNQPVLLAIGEEKGKEPFSRQKQKFDIRGYSPIFEGNHRGVMYCRQGSRVADFIDYGRRIAFPAQHTEESVLAALQLGSQKWGAVLIGGSEAYKQLCIRVAAEHDIRIANPELRAEMEAAQRTCRQEKASAKSRGWSR